MSDRKKLFRARSKMMSEWYVKERIGQFGSIGTMAEAIVQTEEWWENHLTDGWESFFVLEEAEDQNQPTQVPPDPEEAEG